MQGILNLSRCFRRGIAITIGILRELSSRYAANRQMAMPMISCKNVFISAWFYYSKRPSHSSVQFEAGVHKKKNEKESFPKGINNFSFSSLLLRCGRDSNPRPLAWQASILTNWTTAPFFVHSWTLVERHQLYCFCECKVKSLLPILQIFSQKNFQENRLINI